MDNPLVVYIDSETTVPTNECLDPENWKMFAVLYVIIFVFYLDLDTDRVITERSSGYSCKKLASLNYITRKPLDLKVNKTLLQLRDCPLAVADKKTKLQFLKCLPWS